MKTIRSLQNKWVSRVQPRGPLFDDVARQRGGSFNVKCDVEMTQCVTRIAEDNPTSTLNQINEALRFELPQKPHVCINSVANMLNGQLITMKKMEDAPAERNSPRQQKQAGKSLRNGCCSMALIKSLYFLMKLDSICG